MLFKRMTALVFSILFVLLFSLTAFAATPMLTVDSVSADKGDEVDVSISISHNTGFAAMTLSIIYDKDALTYKSFEKGILSDYTVKDHSSSGVIRLVNVENGNILKDGKLITLKFKVNENADDGLHPITVNLKSGDICDWDLNKVAPEIVSGGVNVGLNNSSSAKSFASDNTSSAAKAEISSATSDTESSESSAVERFNEKKEKNVKSKTQKSQKSNFKIIYLIFMAVLLISAVLVFVFRNKIFRREKV